MSNHSDENLDDLSALGRMYAWVDRKGSVNTLTAVLIVACLVFVALDFTYEKHGHFVEESVIAFYGIFGFISFTGLIFAARGLREIIKRPEDFYGDKAIDAEGDYPADQIEIKGHNDA